MKTGIWLTSMTIIAALSAGCTEDQARYDWHAAHPTTVERHTAVLSVENVIGGRVTPTDERNLNEFVAAYHQQGEAPIEITVQANSVTDAGVQDRAGVLASELVARGVRFEDIKFYKTTDGSPAVARVAFPVYTVSPEECGYWDMSSEKDWGNYITTNFGCSVQHNIDVIAANPADLVQPRPVTGRAAQRSWDIVTAYYAGEAIPGSDDIELDTEFSVD